MFSFPFRFFVSFLYVFRVHKSECKKNVKHFKTKNSLKYKKKKKQSYSIVETLRTENGIGGENVA